MNWYSIETAPTNGKIIDVLFDPDTAEPGMTEFYCPEYKKTRLPRITSVYFDAKRGYWFCAGGLGAPITSVNLTHWQPLPSRGPLPNISLKDV